MRSLFVLPAASPYQNQQATRESPQLITGLKARQIVEPFAVFAVIIWSKLSRKHFLSSRHAERERKKFANRVRGKWNFSFRRKSKQSTAAAAAASCRRSIIVLMCLLLIKSYARKLDCLQIALDNRDARECRNVFRFDYVFSGLEGRNLR